MQRTNLLPCPFCGGDDIDQRVRKTAIVECRGCGAMFISADHSLPEKLWNTRTKPITEQVAKMMAAMKSEWEIKFGNGFMPTDEAFRALAEAGVSVRDGHEWHKIQTVRFK